MEPPEGVGGPTWRFFSWWVTIKYEAPNTCIRELRSVHLAIISQGLSTKGATDPREVGGGRRGGGAWSELRVWIRRNFQTMAAESNESGHSDPSRILPCPNGGDRWKVARLHSVLCNHE